MIKKNLLNQKFGRLTVIERVENHVSPSGKQRAQWLCRCSCSDHNEVIVNTNNLTRGNTQSCGCLHREATAEINKKHGKAGKRIYIEWKNMRSRCYNSGNIGYKNYGSRGISVFSLWKDSFEAFYDYVSKLPHFGEKGYTLNRIDNDGNYEPGNVEWSDDVTQANNRRNNHYITFNGERKTMKQWAMELNINYGTLCHRINDYNWSIERALTEKPIKGKNQYTNKTP